MNENISNEEWEKIWNEAKKKSWDKTNKITLFLFLFDLGLIASSFFLKLQSGFLFTVLSFPLLLLSFMHLYLIMHEATHTSVSRNKTINDLIGHFCGWFTLLPFLPRQRNHLLHHVWVAHPTKDPENKKLIENYSAVTDSKARWMDFIWKSWIPLLGLNHIKDTWMSSLVLGDKHISRHKKEITWAAIYWIGYSALAVFVLLSGLALTFITWFLPSWIFFLMFIELANLPHHAEAPLLEISSSRLRFWEQASVSHNCAPVPFWSKYIMLNFNLHVAHHLFPTVPWYHVPKFHELIGGSADKFNKNEFGWAVTNRRRSLMELMGHFFDKRAKAESK